MFLVCSLHNQQWIVNRRVCGDGHWQTDTPYKNMVGVGMEKFAVVGEYLLIGSN